MRHKQAALDIISLTLAVAVSAGTLLYLNEVEGSVQLGSWWYILLPAFFAVVIRDRSFSVIVCAIYIVMGLFVTTQLFELSSGILPNAGMKSYASIQELGFIVSMPVAAGYIASGLVRLLRRLLG